MGERIFRVAVVDDDPSVLRALCRLLRSRGFDVAPFASGSAFLSATEARQPDCVVLDLHMPETSGFEVQARLFERRAGEPVIVITGDDTPESRSRALGLGARSYLSKPVDGAELLAAIAAAIDAPHDPQP